VVSVLLENVLPGCSSPEDRTPPESTILSAKANGRESGRQRVTNDALSEAFVQLLGRARTYLIPPAASQAPQRAAIDLQGCHPYSATVHAATAAFARASNAEAPPRPASSERLGQVDRATSAVLDAREAN
jgi:hypothetical protein